MGGGCAGITDFSKLNRKTVSFSIFSPKADAKQEGAFLCLIMRVQSQPRDELSLDQALGELGLLMQSICNTFNSNRKHESCSSAGLAGTWSKILII